MYSGDVVTEGDNPLNPKRTKKISSRNHDHMHTFLSGSYIHASRRLPSIIHLRENTRNLNQDPGVL